MIVIGTKPKLTILHINLRNIPIDLPINLPLPKHPTSIKRMIGRNEVLLPHKGRVLVIPVYERVCFKFLFEGVLMAIGLVGIGFIKELFVLFRLEHVGHVQTVEGTQLLGLFAL